jgi:protein-S-isoprenylcysteine O-methyltransferase Ste14
MTETEIPVSPSNRASTFPWPPVLFLAAIGAGLLASWLLPLPWPGLDDVPAHAIGLGFGAIGLILIALGIRALVAYRTTVRPDKASTTLVTDGPYAWFRNPIYLGQVLLLFAGAELTKSIWYVAAGLASGVLVTVLQILPEERHLEAQFADVYLDYKSGTRRWI